jgi:hypothetical protein
VGTGVNGVTKQQKQHEWTAARGPSQQQSLSSSLDLGGVMEIDATGAAA